MNKIILCAVLAVAFCFGSNAYDRKHFEAQQNAAIQRNVVVQIGTVYTVGNMRAPVQIFQSGGLISIGDISFMEMNWPSSINGYNMHVPLVIRGDDDADTIKSALEASFGYPVNVQQAIIIISI